MPHSHRQSTLQPVSEVKLTALPVIYLRAYDQYHTCLLFGEIYPGTLTGRLKVKLKVKRRSQNQKPSGASWSLQKITSFLFSLPRIRLVSILSPSSISFIHPELSSVPHCGRHHHAYFSPYESVIRNLLIRVPYGVAAANPAGPRLSFIRNLDTPSSPTLPSTK